MILFILAFLIFVAYALLILFYHRHWKALKTEDLPTHCGHTKVSLVIPARNEAANLPRLLAALQKQSYPPQLLEIILVDDFSTDGSGEIVTSFGLRNLKLVYPGGSSEASSKKKAVATGVQVSEGELIITTDADCLPPVDWVATLVCFYEKTGAAFIAAPVCFHYNNRALQIFQAMDFMILQGITAASVAADFHTMCNGANLAYRRQAFFEVGGFEGIDHVASGDDLLLMHKIRMRFPGQVFYLKNKNAIVATEPMKNLKDFVSQRKRWASKTFVYQDKRIFAALALVYLFNLMFPVLCVAGFFHSNYWVALIALLMLKALVEFPFVLSIARFYNSGPIMKYFLFFQPFHIAYTVVVGFISQLGEYEWKGRKTK